MPDFSLSFRWLHLIDILIISFILHRIFLLLRGRNAFQMMLGLISILLLQAGAQAAGLVLTSWFLAGLGAIALVALAILFRWEFRELLLKFNPLQLLPGLRPLRGHRHQLEPAIQAAFKLARSGTGALIVVRNRDRLSGHLRDGYELNGKLIPEIIQSFFVKESPVHDGAIVITGNRIDKVGAFLPLSTREDIPRHFGTRHRAAIGLTERTDAFVIVVSEEREEVALVENGVARTARHPEELRQLLRIDDDRSLSTSFRALARAGLTKITVFALIFLIVSSFWGLYFGRQSYIEVTTPIDFRNIQEDIILKSSSKENVGIHITGNRIMINDLEEGDVRVFVDMSELEDGFHTVVLENRNVELPTGLRVTQIRPHRIMVELDKLIQKKIGIKARLSGGVPAGFQVAHLQVEPDTIVVRGPSSELLMDRIYTTPIKLENIEGSQARFAVNAALDLPHPAIEPVDDSGTVRVWIRLIPMSKGSAIQSNRSDRVGQGGPGSGGANGSKFHLVHPENIRE